MPTAKRFPVVPWPGEWSSPCHAALQPSRVECMDGRASSRPSRRPGRWRQCSSPRDHFQAVRRGGAHGGAHQRDDAVRTRVINARYGLCGVRVGEASHPGLASKRRRTHWLRALQRSMDSDGESSSEMGMPIPTQVDTDSEDARPLVWVSRVPRDVVEALEEDLSEAHPGSQSQSVMEAHADLGESGRVMGVAEMVDISTPRGVVPGSSAIQVVPCPLPIWRDHPQRAPQQQCSARVVVCASRIVMPRLLKVRCRCLKPRGMSCRMVLERRCHVKGNGTSAQCTRPDVSGWCGTVQHIATFGQRKVFCGTWQRAVRQQRWSPKPFWLQPFWLKVQDFSPSLICFV